jgi:hypothetical protein
VSRIREAATLALALCSLVLGLAPWQGYLPIPQGIPSDPLTLKTLVKVLLPILGGAVLAILLGRWGHWSWPATVARPLVAAVDLARRAALAFAAAIERIDDTLRQWSSASLSLLVLVLLFGAAMLATR